MTINDTLFINGQFSVEGKQYKTVGVKHGPWPSTADFLTAMPAQLRHEGMIAFVQGVSEIEFWQFDGGIADADLTHKFSTAASKITFVATTLPPVGVVDMLYVTKSTGNISIWDGTMYQIISGDGFGVTLRVNGADNDTQAILNFIDSADVEFTYISGGDVKATIVNGKLVPLGGETAQPLVKASNTDNDVEWGTVPLPYAAATEVTSNNYRVLFPVSEVSYVEGRAVIVKFPTANTGAVTLEYESLGSRNVVNTDGTALTAGDIVANAYYELIATSTELQIARVPANLSTANLIIQTNTTTPTGVLASKSAFESALAITSVQQPKIVLFEHDSDDATKLRIGVNGLKKLPDNIFQNSTEITGFYDLGTGLEEIGNSAFESSTLKEISSETVRTIVGLGLGYLSMDLIYFPKIDTGGWGSYYYTNVAAGGLCITVNINLGPDSFKYAGEDVMYKSNVETVTGLKTFTRAIKITENTSGNSTIDQTNNDPEGGTGFRFYNDLGLTTQILHGGSTDNFFPNIFAFDKLSGHIAFVSRHGEIYFSTQDPNANQFDEADEYGFKLGLSSCVILKAVTKTQRDALTNLEVGAIIYQTDNTTGLYVYNGAGWLHMTQLSADGTTLTMPDVSAATASKILLNGGRATIQADGNDFTIFTGATIDSSKQMYFKNFTRQYMRLYLSSGSNPSTDPMIIEISARIEPDSNNAYDIGTPTKKIKAVNAVTAVLDELQLKADTAPATATDTGTAGEIRQDGNYIYVCTATNTWKRAALSTW